MREGLSEEKEPTANQDVGCHTEFRAGVACIVIPSGLGK